MPDRSALDPKALASHIDAVRALARSLLGDADAADDIAQDAAVIALERGGGGVHSPRGWFAGVARNLSRRRIRDRTRRARREHAVARPESETDAAELVGRATEQRRVLDHLVTLPDPYRGVLLLRFFEGLPPRDIAKRLGTPVETVRTQVRRGLAQLRERLETELRVDGRTWRQGLALAAGVGSHLGTRAPGAVGSKVAMAVGLALALGTAVWWAASTLEDSAAHTEDEIVDVADTTSMTGDATAEEDDKPIALAVPKWVPIKGDEPRVDADAADAGKVPAPGLVRSEDDHARRRTEHTAHADTEPREPVLPTAPPRAVPRRMPERIHTPFQSQDAGMVKLPHAWVHFGTDEDWTAKYATTGAAKSLVGVTFESPTFRKRVEEVFIDRFEITNAQYELYLKDVGKIVSFETGDFRTRTLTDVVAVLWGPEPIVVDAVVAARQLFTANAKVLMEAMPERVVHADAGTVNVDRTFQNFYEHDLARGIPLRFYARPIPPDWPGMEPLAHRRDHPVIGLSYAEALGYAEWAGKHICTEFEWEYAARGRSSWEWPWGGDARDFSSRVNGGRSRKRQDDVPDTMPVTTLADGRSPFGCYHMLGNAAEWTSSPLRAYPELKQNAAADGLVRRVIRGGSADNRNMGALRPAFRGWENRRLLLRPGSRAFLDTPEPVAHTLFQRVPWAGFRTAWFEEVGLSRLATMRERMELSSGIPGEVVSKTFQALESNDFAQPGARISEGKFVQGRAHALVFTPFAKAVTPQRLGGFGTIDSPDVVDMERLVDTLHGQPMYFGLLHTDWPLELSRARVWPVDRRVPQWYGPKSLTGTYLLYLVAGKVRLRHLMTGRQFDLPRATARIREGARPYDAAKPTVRARASQIQSRGVGRMDAQVIVPYSASTDTKHMVLDTTITLELGRSTSERPWRRPEPGSR